MSLEAFFVCDLWFLNYRCYVLYYNIMGLGVCCMAPSFFLRFLLLVIFIISFCEKLVLVETVSRFFFCDCCLNAFSNQFIYKGEPSPLKMKLRKRWLSLREYESSKMLNFAISEPILRCKMFSHILLAKSL